MGQPISGKNAYAYVGGNAVVNLKDWSITVDASPIDLDPDISSTRISSVAGFIRETGSLAFNFSGDDFTDLWDAVHTQSAVALYLYPETGSSKHYIYGNAFLTNLSHTNPLLGTVAGSVDFVNSDSTGFSRQTTAA